MNKIAPAMRILNNADQCKQQKVEKDYHGNLWNFHATANTAGDGVHFVIEG